MPSLTSTLVSLLVSAASIGQVRAVDPLVDLGYTKLQGVAEPGGATRWLGVRYAAAPLGELRFAAPVDPPNTADVVDASKVWKNSQVVKKKERRKTKGKKREKGKKKRVEH